MRHNLVHDINSWGYGGWGIYTDEGSTGVTIEQNIVYRTKSNAFNQHYGRDNIVRHNIFVAGGDAVVSTGRADPESGQFTMEHNILVTNGKPVYQGGHLSDIRQPSFTSDRNLVWDTSKNGGEPSAAAVNLRGENGAAEKMTWNEWRARGNDAHSLIADPRFVNAAKNDYRIKPDSPALRIGFRGAGLSQAGVRHE